MELVRFKEFSDGPEAESVVISNLPSLKQLEHVPALLMYEATTEGPNTDIVRCGYLRQIKVGRQELTFKFSEEGCFSRAVVREFVDRLGIHNWEFNRTHWAVKDGDLPTAMLSRLHRTYDVVLSFAGEDRKYVERVAKYLRSNDVRVFYDGFEQADLWGKDLAEHFDLVYQQSGQYCAIFVSESYAKKMWTRHERRSALARALKESKEYILPAYFDETELPGIPHTVGHISLKDETPIEFAKLILKKLGKQPSNARRKMIK